ncbi:MAG: hypothetical protein ACOCQW_04670 [Halanaerobiaceae bacterium]
MLQFPVSPMLLSTKSKPFNSDKYIFEFKWDGYRSITFIKNKNVILQSRNRNNLSKYFPELMTIDKNISANNAILDSEICILDNKGRPIFNKLQKRFKYNTSPGKNKTVLIVWDILSYNDKDIYHLPLIERKKYLNDIVKTNKKIIISPFINTHGIKLYQKAECENLEGIVAKKISSPYEFKRSKYWYKIKCWQYKNVFIGGFDKNKNSLAVGDYDCNKKLIYMGKVKLSLSNEMFEALFKFLPSLKKDSSPFINIMKLQDMNWTQPFLKTKIRYTELTKKNTFRHGYAVEILY